MKLKKSILKLGLFLCILTIGIGCDQTTKEIAKTQLAYQAPVKYYEGLFTLTYYENSGAFLGMGEQLSPSIKLMLLILLPFLILLISTFHIFKNQFSGLYFLGFSLLIAGGLGNLIDRWMDGFVIDFMHIRIMDTVKTGVFNFADVYITVGVLLLFFYFWKYEK